MMGDPEEEAALVSTARPVTLESIAQKKDQALAILEAREQILTNLFKAAIRRTEPQDWVLFKNKAGQEVAMLGNPGAARVAALYGIKVFNLRGPDGEKVAQPVMVQETDKSKTAVIIGDAICAFTGMSIEGLRAARNSKEQFTGRPREGSGSVGEACSDQDLRTAAYSLLFSKAVRVLTGTNKVSIETLKANGVAVEKCTKGSGYGSASERGAATVADADVPAKAEELRKALLKATGGDAGAAKDLLLEITAKPDGSFKGFDSVARMTKSWQVENAADRLKKHPVFGEKESGAAA
jgi:hypothetical protein